MLPLLNLLNKLLDPEAFDKVLDEVQTDSSTNSYWEIVENPPAPLKSKFLALNLSLSNREEIYSALCTLSFIENNNYKIEKYYGGKEIDGWRIR